MQQTKLAPLLYIAKNFDADALLTNRVQIVPAVLVQFRVKNAIIFFNGEEEKIYC